eukprot:scaffold20406_cov103-Isochrysis_galbana.AAC.3
MALSGGGGWGRVASGARRLTAANTSEPQLASLRALPEPTGGERGLGGAAGSIHGGTIVMFGVRGPVAARRAATRHD